ncbi:hypothetical protein HCC61_26120 [Streptomyces sp. HNM0575]|uniref:hypothetical protein n=1 Tax=Streptomyces sp. HNM0575 TaxID=2716338 RepID=UPI00145DC253|nr:hypothetical protein [Streptomyces sp. HNM0575]NLU76083.1 hypothetical protein [Streptomyces sp. HNM0575]
MLEQGSSVGELAAPRAELAGAGPYAGSCGANTGNSGQHEGAAPSGVERDAMRGSAW